jgi:hypothetical protein
MPIQGGCLCGQFRYEIAAEAPKAARVCWCRVCQYLGAGTGTGNAVFDKAALTSTGELSTYVSIADSGSKMTRSFCAKCGTPVFSEAEPRPNVIIVRVGTLDNPELGKPSGTIWTSAAPNWACIDEGLPQGEGQALPG